MNDSNFTILDGLMISMKKTILLSIIVVRKSSKKLSSAETLMGIITKHIVNRDSTTRLPMVNSSIGFGLEM
ncbi:MAG: hypothetical protein SFY68_07920 [Candidatus Sumerlaeia bacterium]|nr:hypothetical protein [Candidatus Sumerlaeia bacterium]